MAQTLTQLFLQYGADKNTNFHNYAPMYEHWLANRDVASMLEVGLLRGESAAVWVDYFPNAKIYMMDNFAQVRRDIQPKGYTIVEGDSTRRETWIGVPDDLDVIIDDGSHKPFDQINTFTYGFPHLRSGGLYFIEDTYFNFNTAYSGIPQDILYPWVIQKVVSQTRTVESGETLAWPESEIYAYHFYKKIVMFEKA